MSRQQHPWSPEAAVCEISGHMGLQEAVSLVARAHPGPSAGNVMNPQHSNLVVTWGLLEPSTIPHPPVTHDIERWLS